MQLAEENGWQLHEVVSMPAKHTLRNADKLLSTADTGTCDTCRIGRVEPTAGRESR